MSQKTILLTIITLSIIGCGVILSTPSKVDKPNIKAQPIRSNPIKVEAQVFSRSSIKSLSSSSSSSISSSSSATSSVKSFSSSSEVITPLRVEKPIVEANTVSSSSISVSSSSSSSVDARMESWAKHYEGIEPFTGYIPNGKVLIVDKSEQSYQLLVDGNVVKTGDVTTGGHYSAPDGMWSETHSGVYWVANKSQDVEMALYGSSGKISKYFISLRGKHNARQGSEEYIGIHDANWRTTFGKGFDYKNRGTNGCISAPLEDVKYLFEELKLNDVVIVKE